MHTPVDPTGQQIHLTRGDVTAHIAQVGAALRGLTVDGTSVVTPYPQGIQAPFGSGTVLAPWPNRIRDGRWQQSDPHGRDYDEQLGLSEPKLDNAIHGFLQHTPFVVDEGDGSATLTATVVPQKGYPFAGRHVGHIRADRRWDPRDAPLHERRRGRRAAGRRHAPVLPHRGRGSARPRADDSGAHALRRR